MVILVQKGKPVTNLYTQKQVTKLADDNGFSTAASKYAGAIAMCETLTFINGKQFCDFDLVGDQNLANSTWGYSYSAWQIRSLRADKGTGQGRDEDMLKDPAYAARMAFSIYKGAGYKWTAWSTYNSGAYLGFMGSDPVAAVPAGSYRVTGGDTLTKIALKTGGYRWQDIALANHIPSPYVIYPGQVLLLPDFPHTVVRGESLTSIATRYGSNLTVQHLADYNHTTLTSILSIGQVLNIPRI